MPEKYQITNLLTRYIPSLFAENPSALNSQIVQNAFLELLAKRETLQQNVLFNLPGSLELKLRNGKKLMSELCLCAEDFNTDEDYVKNPIKISLHLDHRKNTLSSRDFYTVIKYPNRKNAHVLITSYSQTAFGWEGNGFGTALINLSDEVVGFAMQHFTLWDSLPIKAKITDQSSGKFIRNRYGWTSFQARTMRYKKRGNNFYKWYRQ